MLYDTHVIAALRKRIEGNGLRATARELGYSAPFVGDVAKGNRNLTESMGNKLGFVLVSTPPAVIPPREWRYEATDAATTEWERKNYPQRPKRQ